MLAYEIDKAKKGVLVMEEGFTAQKLEGGEWEEVQMPMPQDLSDNYAVIGDASSERARELLAEAKEALQQ